MVRVQCEGLCGTLSTNYPAVQTQYSASVERSSTMYCRKVRN